LLCEHDPALASVLLDLFAEEQIDVVVCDSFEALDAATVAHPEAVVVSDSWVEGGMAQLTNEERLQLRVLGQRVPVIMTTGRDWAKHTEGSSIAERVVVLPKPYDIEELIAAVRAAAG
jgi:two-component system nitrogen regulation response regulator GlnG